MSLRFTPRRFTPPPASHSAHGAGAGGRAARRAVLAAALAPALGLVSWSAPGLVQAPDAPARLPTRCDAGRWFVRPVTAAGDTLDLYTDTGGGRTFVVREALAPGAPVAVAFALAGDSAVAAPWAATRVAAAFPAPLGGPPGTPAPDLVTLARAAVRRADHGIGGRDGVLGNEWFAGRVWAFDYPGHTLTLLPARTVPVPLGPAPAGGPDAGGRTIPLYFRNPPTGGDAPWHPRVQVLVDGDTLDLLFDTGATTVWSDSARRAVGDRGPATRAASFIRRGVADRWRRRHPDWRVIAGGDTLRVSRRDDLGEVPALTVAGLTAGPVWFAVQSDATYREYMAQFMDRPVNAALGQELLDVAVAEREAEVQPHGVRDHSRREAVPAVETVGIGHGNRGRVANAPNLPDAAQVDRACVGATSVQTGSQFGFGDPDCELVSAPQAPMVGVHRHPLGLPNAS